MALVALAMHCLILAGPVGAQSVDVRTGTFMPYRSLPVQDPKTVAIGDLNSDGRDDLVIATQTGIYQSAVYKLLVYLQTPGGQLYAPVEYPPGNSASLAIADVNSDGRADLLCSTQRGFAVHLQEPSGTLAPPVEYISSLSETAGGSLLVADLTNDGRPDVAVVMGGSSASSIEIVRQTPENALVFAVRYQAQGSSLSAGDFNSDGLTDILAAPGYHSFAVYRQLPGGGFATPSTYTYPGMVTRATAGDVNGDGRDDVIVLQDNSFPTIGVWLQSSSGTLTDGPDYRAYQGAESLETGDFNGDGRTDLAVMNGSWEGLSLYLQKQDGSLADREIYPAPYSGGFEKLLATGDLNGDGQRDAVVLNEFGASVFYQAPRNSHHVTNVASFDGLFASLPGATPLRELILDQNGNFYGTAPNSGLNSFGAVFRVTPDGLLTAVGQLGAGTGAHPVGGVVQGNDGNFYGSTTDNIGGAHTGTLFRLTPGGTLTTLVQFNGGNGSIPRASLAKGVDGDFYGTTSGGGASNYGVIFKLTAGGAYTVLHDFDGTSGREPLARLKQGHDGLLYGTTRQGGASGNGTVFSISPSGAFTHLASFDGINGAHPYGEVTQAPDESWYGTASEGGDHGFGTIFRLQGEALQGVYSFSPETGVFPEGGLALANDGTSFYGTASEGGKGGYGTVFRFETTGALTVLSAFGFWNGAFPTSTPLFDGIGNLYGTTAEGGLFGDGSIYRIALDTPSPKEAITPANLSTRGYVGVGEGVLIGGYIIAGTAPKSVIMRALGPSLAGSGVPGAIADPTLTLYDAQGTVIAENDNWRDGPNAGLIAATIPPPDDREAAIAQPLQPGAYTAVVRGVGGTTGIGLVEIYDVEPQSNSKLLNLSTRVEVSSGARAMIGGFIVPNGPSARILVRAIGPSLSNIGFPFPRYLSYPKIELRDAGGNLIASNSEWVHSSQKGQIAETGLPPMSDSEPAILVTVPPGNYTAVVQGTLLAFPTGIALVEIYALER